jgi:hypothetical protein
MIPRRTLLQRFSAGAGGLVFAPFLQRLDAQERGTYRTPKRVVFVLFGNGFHEWASVPEDISLNGSDVRELPLDSVQLPHDIEPFTPFKDRLAIVQGLRSGVVQPDHGAGFAALTGMNNGVGDAQHRNVIAESIDAAVARKLPGIFPLLNLGIDPGKPETKAILCSSAWGPGRPIATQCRPELAYESLFGSVGAKQNDFAARKNLLDFISDDIKVLESHLTGLEKAQLQYHLEAMESLSRRDAQLAVMYDKGLLAKSAPKLPSPYPVTMKDTLAAQFDIAGSALVTGLTSVVTITSELCRVRGMYTGFSNVGTHALGHNNQDTQQGVPGWEILSRVRRNIAEQTAGLLKKLQEVPEGSGTMLDNTLVVFTSDSANRQHSHGKNWPFVLLGNLGGRLRTNRMVLYPMREFEYGRSARRAAAAPAENPTINALYNTILHAVGDPREHFNLVGANKENPAHRGPLPELLA